MREIKLPSRTITENSPAYVIAEMSASHCGSLDHAIELIHLAKECGADCIKIQTYTADTITLQCKTGDFQIHGGLWDGYCFYDLYKQANTPWEWQSRLKEEADKVGIDFFSTPFDRTAVDFLEELGVEFYKIASFEMVDIPLIKYVASKGKPIIMSTGMATREEVQEAVDAIRSEGNNQLALLKCSSVYPAVPENMNLITVRELANSFDVISGLSDHSFGSNSAMASIVLGGRIIEKHLCIRRDLPNNPDAGFSMEPKEFRQMVDDVRMIQKAVGIEPFVYSERELSSRKNRRSLYISSDVKKGDTFTENNVRSVRPGYGLHTRYYEMILGKKVKQDAPTGTPMSWDLIEDEDRDKG